MSWVAFFLIAAYYLVGQKLTLDAYRYLRDPDRHYSYTPLLSPEEFTDEGEPIRCRAVRYWYVGAVVVFLVVMSIWMSQRP